MNLKFFIATLLATGATASHQGSEIQTLNQAAEQHQALYADLASLSADESMSHRERRRALVRIIKF